MPQIEIPGVGLVEFPDTMSEADISAAAKRLHDEANAPEAGASGAAPAVAAASAALPVAIAGVKRGVEELATNPKVAGLGKKAASMGGLPFRQLSAGKQIMDVLQGKQSVSGAVVDAGRNELVQQALTRAPGLLQKLALRAAPRLAGMTGAVAAPIGLAAAAGMAGYDAYKYLSENGPKPAGERLSQREQLERAMLARQLAKAQDIDLP